MNRNPSWRRLIDLDPWLEPYAHWLYERDARYRAARARIDEHGGLLGPISQGHQYFGFNRGERDGQPGIWYREAGRRRRAWLRRGGDRTACARRPLRSTGDVVVCGIIFPPDTPSAGGLGAGRRVRVGVVTERGVMDRTPNG